MTIVLTKWNGYRPPGMDKIDLISKHAPCTVIDTVMMTLRSCAGVPGLVTVIESSKPSTFKTAGDVEKWISGIKSTMMERPDGEIVFVRNIDDFMRAWPIHEYLDPCTHQPRKGFKDAVERRNSVITDFIMSVPTKKLVLMSNVRLAFEDGKHVDGKHESSVVERLDGVKLDNIIETWDEDWWKHGARVW